MNSTQLNHFKTRLEEELLATEAEIKSIKKSVDQTESKDDVESALDEDFAIDDDKFVDNQQFATWSDLRNEILVAQNKLETGEGYGICETCGLEINEKRLEALPYTRYCIECQAKTEKTVV